MMMMMMMMVMKIKIGELYSFQPSLRRAAMRLSQAKVFSTLSGFSC